MNKRRLLRLADLLEADAKNRHGVQFDLSEWGRVYDPDKPVSCNTTACAMGLAAVSGAFKRQGLMYEIFNNQIYISRDDGLTLVQGGFAAASSLFDISSEESIWLFDYPSYSDTEIPTGAKGERLVAKRIRKFVAGEARP